MTGLHLLGFLVNVTQAALFIFNAQVSAHAMLVSLAIL
jgi:hypothetical protein